MKISHSFRVGDRVRLLAGERRHNRNVAVFAGELATVEAVYPDAPDAVVIRTDGGGIGSFDTIRLERVILMKKRCSSWFQTFTGIKFDPRRATAKHIVVEDIAHALSNYCRYGGHTTYFYSVAQHACLCHDHVPNIPQVRSQALFHDGTEAYLGDVVKPLKVMLPDYQAIEKRLEKIIMRRFNLPVDMLPDVRNADITALATERRDLLPGGPIWETLKGVICWPEPIVPWPPAVAKEQFMMRYRNLVKTYQ